MAYLVAPKAKSCIARYLYCSNHFNIASPTLPLNSPFHVECKVLRSVVTSAVEAKKAGLFYNCQTAIYLHHMLAALGHEELNTLVKTDIGTAAQLVSDTIKNKHSKSLLMLFQFKCRTHENRTIDRRVNNKNCTVKYNFR